MVRFEDTLHGHAFYVTAACGIIDTYLRTRDRWAAVHTRSCEQASSTPTSASWPSRRATRRPPPRRKPAAG